MSRPGCLFSFEEYERKKAEESMRQLQERLARINLSETVQVQPSPEEQKASAEGLASDMQRLSLKDKKKLAFKYVFGKGVVSVE